MENVEENMFFWVTVQAPRDEKIFNKVVKELSAISVNGVGFDVEFICKIRKQDWLIIVNICDKYLLNGTVIGESDKP
jgi:hypothetical protein